MTDKFAISKHHRFNGNIVLFFHP